MVCDPAMYVKGVTLMLNPQSWFDMYHVDLLRVMSNWLRGVARNFDTERIQRICYGRKVHPNST